MITLQADLVKEIGTSKVKVYYNLQKRCYSVQYKGAVVAHLTEVTLKCVEFRVNEAGRQRVIATKHKNVHAYCTGTLTCSFDPLLEPRQATYNPYKAGYFYDKADDTPIYHTARARLSSDGITVLQSNKGEPNAKI